MAGELTAGYRHLREDAGAVWLERDALRVNGPDALAFLDGQLSQDLKALSIGAAADALLLQPQGKVVALLRVQRSAEDEFILDMDAGCIEAVIERLERFKLRTKATIEKIPGWKCVGVRGPHAHDLGIDGLAADWPGLPGVDLTGTGVALPDGIPVCGADAYEAVRIEAGVPLMGRELTETTIPAEATGVIERAVSFTKGCYTGQELVARIDSRGGNVPRRLHGVEFTGDEVPEPGTALSDASGADIGVVTSAAWSPRTGRPVALAYVSRKVQPPADIAGGTVKPLPLV
jgi:tRNA-modifying protein YgfZ